jgi:hypothetical protein
VGTGQQLAVWGAQPGSQAAFVACPVFETLYHGTRGPGKTNALLLDFCQHVGKGHGRAWRGILFRQSFPALADVVNKSLEWIPRTFPEATYNASTYTWTFPDGASLLFRYIAHPRDYWSYHGHEYPWIGWDELTNWPSAECYDVMKSCCRSSTPGVPRKYRATANPHGPGHHWVKARFIEPATDRKVIRDALGPRVAIHGHWRENRHLLAADPDYADRLKSSTADNPDQAAAWLDGSWDIVAGTFFGAAWDAKVHILPTFPVPQGWRINRAFDWGSSKPFSVGWWAECDGTDAIVLGQARSFPRGTLIRIGEWYGCQTGKPNVGLGLDAKQIAAGILERQKLRWPGAYIVAGPADSSIFDVQDGHCIADSFRNAGVTWEKANKGPGSRVNGWALMRERFAAAKKREGAALYVMDTCRDFIRTIPTLPRSDKNPDDIDTAAEDHIADEVRYRILASPPPTVSSFSMFR